jgi:hypothetical protein
MGRHWLRREGDVLFVRWHGVATLDDMQALHEVANQVRAEHGYAVSLQDGTHGKGMTPEARRWLMSLPRRTEVIAIFGAPFFARVAGTMVQRAMSLLLEHAPAVGFFETEAEARAFLDDERRRLLARLHAR